MPDYPATLDTPPESLRIGLVREFFGEGLDPEVEAAVREAIRVYEAAGATIKEVSLPHSKYGVPAYYIVAPAECSSNLARYDGTIYGHRAEDFSPKYPGEENLAPLVRMMMASRAEGFGAEVKRRIMLGTFALSAGYADQYYNQALKVRRLIRNDFDAAFKEVDVLLGPTSPTAGVQARRADGRPAGDVPLGHLHDHRQPRRHPRPEHPLRPDRGRACRSACNCWPRPSPRRTCSARPASSSGRPTGTRSGRGWYDGRASRQVLQARTLLRRSRLRPGRIGWRTQRRCSTRRTHRVRPSPLGSMPSKSA